MLKKTMKTSTVKKKYIEHEYPTLNFFGMISTPPVFKRNRSPNTKFGSGALLENKESWKKGFHVLPSFCPVAFLI